MSLFEGDTEKLLPGVRLCCAARRRDQLGAAAVRLSAPPIGPREKAAVRYRPSRVHV